MTDTPTPRPPTLVALIRGAILVGVIAGGAALAAAIPGVDLSAIPPEWRPVAAAGLIVVARTVEGFVDHLRGQAPQAGLIGGAPADPASYLPSGGGTVTTADRARLAELPAYALRDELDRRDAQPPAPDRRLGGALRPRRPRPRR